MDQDKLAQLLSQLPPSLQALVSISAGKAGGGSLGMLARTLVPGLSIEEPGLLAIIGAVILNAFGSNNPALSIPKLLALLAPLAGGSLIPTPPAAFYQPRPSVVGPSAEWPSGLPPTLTSPRHEEGSGIIWPVY